MQSDIADSTRFFEDLGITGLDAEQTMVQVSEKYNVNMDGYEPDEYHDSEGEFGNVFCIYGVQ